MLARFWWLRVTGDALTMGTALPSPSKRIALYPRIRRGSQRMALERFELCTPQAQNNLERVRRARVDLENWERFDSEDLYQARAASFRRRISIPGLLVPFTCAAVAHFSNDFLKAAFHLRCGCTTLPPN